MEVFLDVIVQVMRLLMADTVFLIICLLLLIPLSKFKPATFAVMKRNLYGYFSNPTGYVFICLFVLVGSAFAFWPHEFFNSNLATLGELNKTFPLVMLLFIPTITMSIWADERRNGTDELLLTIPATDWDIVLGKFLAVAAIYTASLVFSQIANFTVLNILALGDIDTGLFATTYFGYWFIGLAMLALGMAASFLTSNLTVGFVLGVLFNAPLVIAANADLIFRSADVAQNVSHWSHALQFQDFGRGVITLRAIVFFTMVVLVGLYISIILIGRRHWYSAKDRTTASRLKTFFLAALFLLPVAFALNFFMPNIFRPMFLCMAFGLYLLGVVAWAVSIDSRIGHFMMRAVALVALAIGLNWLFSNVNVFRKDMTTEKVSSISPNTKLLLNNMAESGTTQIEAFISSSVPEQYTRTKVDLITMLNEFKAQGGKALDVRIYDNLEPFSEGATRADQQYKIQPSTVFTEERGTQKQQSIFLAAAFQKGEEKVIVPFFDQGTPVEYELIRSINTVNEAKRPRIGVVRTKTQLFGGMDMRGQTPQQMIIDELEKQYEIVQVDPNSTYEKFDVLMVVQPSSLTPPQLDNLIDAVRSGQPTAVFEDPLPAFMQGAPGTGQPNPPQGGGMMGMMGGGGRPGEPKCDITRLWSMLGIELNGKPGFGGPFNANVIYQRYNPYPKARAVSLTHEFVFASPAAPGARADDAISTVNPITSGLDQLLFPFPGAIRHDDTKGMTFESLVETGTESGVITFEDIRQAQMVAQQGRGSDMGTIMDQFRDDKGDRYCLAARITGKVKDANATAGPGADATKTDDKEVNVVFVADTDLLAGLFLMIRARPSAAEVNWQFDNVPFVLNILDYLAGDDRLIEIRKRQTRHSTLKMVDIATESARDSFTAARDDFEKTLNAEKEGAQAKMQEALATLQEDIRIAEEKGDNQARQRALIAFQMQQSVQQRKVTSAEAKAEQERDQSNRTIERELNQKILSVQNFYKTLAVLLPPLPPLIVGMIVFWRRRQRELVGVIDERRR